MQSGPLIASWRILALAGLYMMSGVTAATTAADAPPLILEHLTTADSLPQSTVYETLQDSQGFIWLGTEDGLVRYDGFVFVWFAFLRVVCFFLFGFFVFVF